MLLVAQRERHSSCKNPTAVVLKGIIIIIIIIIIVIIIKIIIIITNEHVIHTVNKITLKSKKQSENL